MNQIIHSPIKTLKNLTYTILIISILTLILDPSVLLYLFFFDAIWFALFLSYGNRKNRFWLMNSLTIALGSAIAFVLIKLLTGSHIRSMTLPEISLLSLGALEVLIAADYVVRRPRNPAVSPGSPDYTKNVSMTWKESGSTYRSSKSWASTLGGGWGNLS